MSNEQNEIKNNNNLAKNIWNLRFYFRKWLFHRTLAPFIGAPIFYLSYFILPAVALFLVVSPILRISLNFNLLNYLVSVLNYKTAGIVIAISVVIYFFIFYLRLIRYPRSPRNKIGIGVAFAYDFMGIEKLKDSLRYRDLVIRELEKIIDQEKLSHIFKIIKLNDYHANRFYKKFGDKKSARNYIRKTRIIFTIFGYVKSGKHNKEDRYKYELEYLVGHSLVPIKNCQLMSKKFSKQLRRQKWEFKENNSGIMSEGIAGNIRENAFFAIGVSSFYSKNPQVAIVFLKKLLDYRIKRPDLMIDVKNYLAYCNFYIGRIFALNKIEKNWLSIAIKRTEQAVSFKPNYYQAYILLCYLYYKNKDIDNAFKAISKAQKFQSNAVWRFNKAFLYFYLGDSEKLLIGLNIYKSIKKNQLIQINKDIFNKEIIPSLIEVISEEQKNQFYYPLIFIYSKALDNKDKATEFYNLFLEKEKNNTEMKLLLSESKRII